MEENTVARLTRNLQNTDTLSREFQHLQSALRQMVEEDYLQKIRAAAREEQAVTVEHPSREITLLRALSAFADDRGRQQLDQACRGLVFLQTMTRIQQGVQRSEAGLLETRSSGGTPAFSPARASGLFMGLSLLSEFLSEQPR
ncbi:hypothetical protein H9X85_10200 [Anaerotignum lactatifermentans]|uniref:Uncharacterized protein n=1 Tax=Anaerotignum lactatifermentans TaxID=160404 RepID=A0ABS2GBK0_9FIRM|nr:hypothetical protein [Anaerotignum lactatifermentans]MBM6829912.1 hypothetical protein [Anaerotignum lactatifermentans]MBM6878415.1 hypothetical protein [Anaerotignum lactatifermentans]MBM6951569.1 hypothetical protein [Anaerotignum lactatifermentans]